MEALQQQMAVMLQQQQQLQEMMAAQQQQVAQQQEIKMCKATCTHVNRIHTSVNVSKQSYSVPACVSVFVPLLNSELVLKPACTGPCDYLCGVHLPASNVSEL